MWSEFFGDSKVLWIIRIFFSFVWDTVELNVLVPGGCGANADYVSAVVRDWNLTVFVSRKLWRKVDLWQAVNYW